MLRFWLEHWFSNEQRCDVGDANEWRTLLKGPVKCGGWDPLRGQYQAERRALKEARKRCFTPTCKDFADYGGRGITVAREWIGPEGFVRFFEHIGPKPTSRHTLDRIDVNRGYIPGNVRWADWREQANNRRSSRSVRWGDEVMTAADLGRIFDLPRQAIVKLANKGWFPVDDNHIRTTQAAVDKTWRVGR
jgi:hypothetical protein